ncbi:hypothetical protein [Microvirga makkahensis]|uniref:RidA family protein n=1 Tax=Microvirga makkahensis TaxID=1128670 RepID=A0A7X3SMK9_9HYPH|nr:hypothetical protein [Microvirga makkahensis]MXQ10233.1 hypothetical protein [Microvirga makkahensis]
MTTVPPTLAVPLRRIEPPRWPSLHGHSHAAAGTGTFVLIGGQIATGNAAG